MHRRATNQAGFTLIELLVVIAVLGTLSGVAVVATGTLRDQAQGTMCATDQETLSTAQEAARLQGGAYLDESTLVAEGYLERTVDGIDVVLTGDGYQLVTVGECAGGSEELADGPSDDEQAKADEPTDADEQATADERAKAEEQAKLDEQAKADEQAAREAEERAKAEAEEREKAAEKAAGAEEPFEPKGCEKGQIDINTADKKQLRAITHIGGDEATRIEKQRPFTSLEQLVEVKGLDEGDVKDITEQGLACVSR